MDTSSAFPSSFLKAEDLKGAQPIVTISEVLFEKVGDENKLLLKFEGKDKSLVLNKTNWTTICELAGSKDSDKWIGLKIRLRKEKTSYQGRPVDAVRVDPDFSETRQAGEEEIPF